MTKYQYKTIKRFNTNKWRFLLAAEKDGWLILSRKAIIPSKENGYPLTAGVELTFFKPIFKPQEKGETK